MKSQKTVWINVTTSSAWSRAVVGIVRVELELSAGLEKLYPKGSFKRCIWQNGAFVEHLSMPAAHQREVGPKEKGVGRVVIKARQAPLLYPVLSRREAIKSLAQGVLSLAPSRFRPLLSRVLHFLRGRLARFVYSPFYLRLKQRGGVASVRAGVTDLVHKKQSSIFAPGDVLLSVGLDWDYPYAQEFSRLKKSESVKIVRCCYDLIPVLYPQYCVADVAAHFTRYFLDLADSADQVLCISRQSESDLNGLLSSAGGRVVSTKVFVLGDNIVEEGSDQIGDVVHDIAAQPFILYVSTVERRKNHQVLYQAYHHLCKQGKKDKLPRLVFVGMQGWGVDELLKDLELDPVTKGMILLCNHVNDAELRLLYQKALCCVFPSLYEGWGLPVGEALAMGKIVLSSDRGSLKEVGGDLVTYIDPWHPKAWAEKIWEIVSDDEYRQAFTNRVKSGYIPRQWQDVAVSVKVVLDALLESPAQTQTFYAGYDLVTDIGLSVGSEVCSRGKLGRLFEGPHKAMSAGVYLLEVWDCPDRRVAGSCSIRVLADGREIAHKRDITFAADQGGALLESVSIELPRPIRDLNVQCELVAGELVIDKVVFLPV